MDGSQLHSTLRGWLIKTVCTNNSRRVYTNVVTRVCGSVGRLNPTTVVQMYRSKWWKFTFWNFAAVPVPVPVAYVVVAVAVAPQIYPNSTGPNVSERNGIILADLHKSLQIWGWFLPKKNRPPHPRGGGRSGNFRQSKSQNSGKCHELSRKSIKKNFFLHIPPRGVPGRGGWGSTFKKSGKFHELSRKSIKKSPPPHQQGSQWEF